MLSLLCKVTRTGVSVFGRTTRLSVNLKVNFAATMAPVKVCVVGAGVVGLSTAVNVIESISNVDVTLIADKLSPDTTGDGAAGITGPRPFSFGDTDKAMQRKWFEESNHHFETLMKSQYADVCGVQYLSGYLLDHDPDIQKSLPWLDLMYNVQQLSEKELKKLFPDSRNALFFTMITCDCRRYLPFLMKRFEGRGGHFIQKHLGKLDELAGQYDVIVNCTGIGAHQLVNDDTLQPARGQAIRVHAPWIKHFTYTNTGPSYYVVPGVDDVYLGGTFDYGNWSKEVNEKDKQTIYETCCKMVPSLRRAKWKYDWVGLRPIRPVVRVEKEIMKIGDSHMKVVHNYGHGPKGICYSWGSAIQATQLVKEILSEQRPNARL
ncbi:D-aspartate oxidase-like [Glandiceps talaboti]